MSITPEVYQLVRNVIAPGGRAFMSPRVQEAIDKVMDKELPEGWKNNDEFRKSLSRDVLNNDFTNYEAQHVSAFYAAYYVPNNLYKIQLLVLDLIAKGSLSLDVDPIRILDIGSSVGTTAWALADLYEILKHALDLYDVSLPLPKLIVTGVEKSPSNIAIFRKIEQELDYNRELIEIIEPEQKDALDLRADDISETGPNLVIVSNVLNEIRRSCDPEPLVRRIYDGMPQRSCLTIVEPARESESKWLNGVRYRLLRDRDAVNLGPCGKLGPCGERCESCWSYRSEKLVPPATMKLFGIQDIEEDKLKWTYLTVQKRNGNDDTGIPRSNNAVPLSNAALRDSDDAFDVDAEIVSPRLFEKEDREHYYIKICDQSGLEGGAVLRVPRYYELPKFEFGDAMHIRDVTISETESQYGNLVLQVNADQTEAELPNPKPTPTLKYFNDVKKENIAFFMKRFFGFGEFRAGQFEIMKRALEGKPVFGILATGGGKSLTFQLPALLLPGTALVVSPLKSLMDDQVRGLCKKGFDFVKALHSGIDLIERRAILNQLRQGHLKILYVAPERLQQASFREELKQIINQGCRIHYMPIDEAHCIAEWGHDFRPSYCRLADRDHEIGNPPMLGLTATASRKVQETAMGYLNMSREHEDLVHSIIDRKELSLEVIVVRQADDGFEIRTRDENGKWRNDTIESPTHDRRELLTHMLKNVLPLRIREFDISKFPGIIFTTYAAPTGETRKPYGAQGVSDYLREKENFDIKCWYSDLPEEEKQEIQEDFTEGRLNLLAATKGFGMGIDKPNIRYVIHHGFPGSLEQYFQEIGRAGRDGKHAHCILLWDPPEKSCWKSLESIYGRNELPIPDCWHKREDKKPNPRFFQRDCQHGRAIHCDYARQVYFIQSSLPNEYELERVESRLKALAHNNGTYPWLYVRKSEIKKILIEEKIPVGYVDWRIVPETLYTLKHFAGLSECYVEIKIQREVSLEEIRESTNNSTIQKHIGYLEEVYGPPFIKSVADGNPKFFFVAEYAMKLREKNHDVLIDDILHFFSLLGDRPGFTVKRPKVKFGLEIKWPDDERSEALSLSLVADWAQSRYQMLWNLVEYANIVRDQESIAVCRRAQMMSMFATEGASLRKDVHCNWCDACGFKNKDAEVANDIHADAVELSYRDQMNDLMSEYSLESSKAINRGTIEKLITQTKLKDCYRLAFQTGRTWIEQPKESGNAIAHTLILMGSFKLGEMVDFKRSLKVIAQTPEADLAVILDMMREHVGLSLKTVCEHMEMENLDDVRQWTSIFKSARMLQRREDMAFWYGKAGEILGREICNEINEWRKL